MPSTPHGKRFGTNANAVSHAWLCVYIYKHVICVGPINTRWAVVTQTGHTLQYNFAPSLKIELRERERESKSIILLLAHIQTQRWMCSFHFHSPPLSVPLFLQLGSLPNYMFPLSNFNGAVELTSELTHVDRYTCPPTICHGPACKRCRNPQHVMAPFALFFLVLV